MVAFTQSNVVVCEESASCNVRKSFSRQEFCVWSGSTQLWYLVNVKVRKVRNHFQIAELCGIVWKTVGGRCIECELQKGQKRYLIGKDY